MNFSDNFFKKIEKKTNTIEKKEALILKKEDKIRKLGVDPDADKKIFRTKYEYDIWSMDYYDNKLRKREYGF